MSSLCLSRWLQHKIRKKTNETWKQQSRCVCRRMGNKRNVLKKCSPALHLCCIIYNCSLQSVWGSARWWGVKLTPVACSYRQRPDLWIDTSVQWVTVSAEESESVSSLFLHSFNRRPVSGCDEDGADANVWCLKLFDFWVDGVKPMKCCERLRELIMYCLFPSILSSRSIFLPSLPTDLVTLSSCMICALLDRHR